MARKLHEETKHIIELSDGEIAIILSALEDDGSDDATDLYHELEEEVYGCNGCGDCTESAGGIGFVVGQDSVKEILERALEEFALSRKGVNKTQADL